MSALALASAQRDSGRPSGSPPAGILAQRRSTLPSVAAVAAPPINDAGSPLDPGTREVMEQGFSRSFAEVRVHDDARAHDNARALDARAYAAGNDLVFAEGAYSPETAIGRALIAHELAHTVQQGGVQMKSAGPVPAGTDHELEAQADRAASAVLAGRLAPPLSRIGAPCIFRNPAADAPPAAPSGTVSVAPTAGLPPGMKEINDPERPGALVVELEQFNLPEEKGLGPWVQQAYTDAATGGRLVFSPLITGNTVAAWKEGSEDYKSIWLGKYGFASTQGVASAFETLSKAPDTTKGAAAVKAAAADPEVRKLITGLASSLKSSGCDIDHIVEKQVGGTSMASNLQLLDSKKNQKSGRRTYEELVKLVNELRAPGMRGAGFKVFQLRIKSATVHPASSDASYIVEKLLRDGDLVGTEAIKAKAAGKPVYLEAGGQGETVNVHDSNPTPIDAMAKRIVPGMRLTNYKRGPGGAASKSDNVSGELDSRAMSKSGAGDTESKVALVATPAPSAAAAAAPAEPGAPAAETVTGEQRKLSVPAGPKKIKFYYPYLSPGYITSLSLDPEGHPTGEGVIMPAVKFLGDLKVRFGKDYFDLVKDIDVAQLNKSAPMRSMSAFFRFVEGADNGFKLDLLKFQPSGTVHFSIGPKAKPYVLGDVTAKAEGTTFVAQGNLKTAPTLPGLKDGSGTITYRSDTGWSGSLKATSSTIRGATADVTMSFAEAKDRMIVNADGKVSTDIRGTQLVLGAEWRDGDLAFYGGATIPKPLPMIESVDLRGRYAKGLLALGAKTKVRWKMGQTDLTGDAVVNYYRKEDDTEGKFSGSVEFIVKNEKMEGKIALALSETGKPSGKGELAYQVTKDFRPKLGVELEPSGKVKLSGSAKFNDIKLTDSWPKPPNDQKTILKASAKGGIPTPVPGLRVTLKVTGELGVYYSVGPLTMKGLGLDASLYPFEEDKQIKAKLTGAFVVPAKGGLYGRFGVLIGADVAMGALAAEGGLYVKPKVGVEGEGGIKIEADYADGGFSFAGEAYARGAMYGSLGIEFAVNVEALWGLVGHEWTFPGPSWGPKKLGPEIYITLGKIGYSRDGTITWPSLSQIEIVTPKEFDPMSLLESVLSDTVGS